VHSIGLVGAGRIARVHAANTVLSDALRLAAVMDVDDAAAQALAAETGSDVATSVEELLTRADVNAVLIATPPDTHAELVVTAAHAGKHVFCEKPLAHNVADAKRAVDACERAGVVLQVGYNRRFDESFRTVRDTVHAGRIGQPWILRISSRDPAPPPATYLPVSGGLFLDTTSHDLDLSRFVLGAEILEISARAMALADPNAKELGDVDTSVVTIVFSNGAIGAIDNCRTSAYGYDQRLEVHGSEGMVQAANEVTTTTTIADGQGFHSPTLPYYYLDRYAPAFRRELESFARALEGAEPEVSGHDGLAAVVAAVAANLALDERRVVRLEEVTDDAA
jgi:myo-inositol 2-dehydrogenase / D-chiro-inositol 1-dehydrogenase